MEFPQAGSPPKNVTDHDRQARCSHHAVTLRDVFLTMRTNRWTQALNDLFAALEAYDRSELLQQQSFGFSLEPVVQMPIRSSHELQAGRAGI